MTTTHLKNDNRSIVLSHIMTPDMANFSGNIHGGHMLHLLDQAAYACAVNYCSTYVITLSVDHVLFKKPIRVGEQVTFYANVNYVGNTSMEVGIKVVAKDLTSKTERHTMTCYFTMVSVNDKMKPIPVPPLVIRNNTEKRRACEAKMRKQMNAEHREKHMQLKRGELPQADL
jgi:acyl-CoA hydrolase